MVEKVHLDFETRVPHAEISVSLFKKLLGSSLALDPSGIYIRVSEAIELLTVCMCTRYDMHIFFHISFRILYF